MNDGQVAELLDELTPAYEERAGDWQAVLRDAHPRYVRSSRRARSFPRWPLRIWLAFVVATALAVAGLAWPFQAQNGGVLERALAAVGDGPVLHVVLRGDWGGTLVDLKTDARRPIHGENELWYDSDRGVVHSITRLGAMVTHEQLYEPKEPPPELTALGREYRQALESGSARIAGEGVVDGEPAVWITIRSEMLPDVADGRDHEWAQQVAVSRRTFKPVALRETRDGEPGPGTGQRVLELETLPAGRGDFTSSEADSLEGRVFKQGREPITLEQARATLGRTPLWLGRTHAELPLARVFRETMSSGRRQEIKITGPDAQAAEVCSRLRGESAGRCFRTLGRHPLVVRPDGVFTFGPVVWDEEQSAVVLFYGTVGDDPSTYRDDLVPLGDRPHLTITETTEPSRFRPGAGRYLPPEGSLFIAARARRGILQVEGLSISIESSSEDSILAAARALKPM